MTSSLSKDSISQRLKGMPTKSAAKGRTVFGKLLTEGIDRKGESGIAAILNSATVGDVAVGVAHDVRNTLFALSAGLATLKAILKKKRIDSDDILSVQQIMSDMEVSIKAASRICLRVQELGGRKKDAKPENVKGLVDSSIEMAKVFLIKASTERKIITIENKTKDDICANVVPSELQLAILNIVINAIEHGFQPGKEGKITVRSGESDSWVYLRIANDGVPIAEEIRGQLLQRPLSSHCRFGYGLYTAAQSIRAFGGDITFTSEPGNTEFTVKLPKK